MEAGTESGALKTGQKFITITIPTPTNIKTIMLAKTAAAEPSRHLERRYWSSVGSMANVNAAEAWGFQ